MCTRHLVVAAALLAGGLLGCGGEGGGGSPTPASPSPVVSSLAIGPATQLLKIKGTETFTATATMSDGTSRAVSAAWTSDNTSVLTVEANGRATAVASGTATVTAQHQGVTARQTLRVVPDYQGTWRGQIVFRKCTDTGDWRGACVETAAGDRDELSLKMTQDTASVSGTIDLGGFVGLVTGAIAMDGTLSLQGSCTATIDRIPFEVALVEWQAASTDNTTMTGRVTFSMRTSMLGGQAEVEADLLDVTKTASALAAPRRSTTAGWLERTARQAVR